MKAWVFTISLLCLPLSSFADILFVGLNENPGEIEAARRAARARGERLVVLGVPTPREKAELRRVEREVQRLEQQADRRPDDRELDRRFREARDRLGELRSQSQYSGRRLAADLQRLQAEGRQFSSMVISGHDGNASFFGDANGTITATEFRDAFATAAPLGDGIRTLTLAGCYTGTLGVIEANWAQILPGLALVTGYDHSAPLGSVEAGQHFLEDVLTRSRQIVAAGDDARRMQAMVRGIRGIQTLNAIDRRPTILTRCGDFLFSDREGVRPFGETLRNCGESLSVERRTAWNERVQCYLAGARGCENPPEDTRAGELRRIYNQIQSARHCQSQIQEATFSVPDPEMVIRLLFARNVQANIAARLAPHLESVNSQLPPDLRLTDLARISRAEAVEKFRRATQYLRERALDLSVAASPDARRVAAARLNLETLNVMLNLNPGYVPFTWVEPNATEAAPHARFTTPEQISPYSLRSNLSDALERKAAADPVLTELARRREEARERRDSSPHYSEELERNYSELTRQFYSLQASTARAMARQELERRRAEGAPELPEEIRVLLEKMGGQP